MTFHLRRIRKLKVSNALIFPMKDIKLTHILNLFYINGKRVFADPETRLDFKKLYV